jgi:hypothetical protein
MAWAARRADGASDERDGDAVVAVAVAVNEKWASVAKPRPIKF